jgi:GNAT superfamily N-acetyltransferase
VVGVRADVWQVEHVDPEVTRELRRAGLRPEWPADVPLPGSDLADAVHLAVRDGDTAVGACFVVPGACPWRPDVPAWHLRQMATHPGWRRRGVGAAVLAEAAAVVERHGGPLIWCRARLTAQPFYERSGWLPVGEVFVDERHTVPHRRMERWLSGSTSG